MAMSFNLVSLTLSTIALLSSYWCEGTQKVPKPLCGNGKATKCIVVPIAVESVNASGQDVVHYSWETGDDRFAFRYFHTGIWYSCEENILGTGKQTICFLCYQLTGIWNVMMFTVHCWLVHLKFMCPFCFFQNACLEFNSCQRGSSSHCLCVVSSSSKTSMGFLPRQELLDGHSQRSLWKANSEQEGIYIVESWGCNNWVKMHLGLGGGAKRVRSFSLEYT